MCKELEETRLKCTQTESELHLKTTDLLAKEQTLSEKEEELQSLRNCLHQVIEKTSDHEPGAEEGVDAPSGEETPDNSERLKSSQLAKIEAMLDTTKVCVCISNELFFTTFALYNVYVHVGSD